MEKFVLTIVRNNMLDNCEVFDNQQDALDSARYFCESVNIKVNSPLSYDPHVRGWLVSESYGYFVTVVQRLPQAKTYMPGSSYGRFMDRLLGRVPAPPMPTSAINDYIAYYGKHPYRDLVTAPSQFVKLITDDVAPTTTIQSPPVSPAVKDDPKDKTLPGGFEWNTRKALTMQQVWDNPGDCMPTHALSEPEKWALVLARTKHRPNQVILLKGLGCWSQHYMLTELTKQTEIGKKMLVQELAEIQAIYDEARYEYDANYEDESSSSEEESDY